MKNILVIFGNSIRQNRLMIMLSLAAAVLMCFIFHGHTHADGKAFTDDKITVGLCDYDGVISDNLKEYFENTLGMEVVEDDYDSLSNHLINRKISAIIEVPPGFYSSAAAGTLQSLEFTMLGDYENAAFIEVYLNSYMNGISVISHAADGDENAFSEMLSSQRLPNEVIISETNSVVDKETRANSAFTSAVGFMMTFVAAITILISRQILNDRNLGTYNRMRCSSIKPLEYVLGVNVFGIICCTVMNLIFVLFVYSAEVKPYISMGAAFGSLELFLLFSIGISTLFGLLVKTPLALMTVGIGYATIGSMLGGAWFPISDNLGAVGNISKLFPQYWLMDIINGFAENSEFIILPNICIIALAAVLTYLVSAVIFTRKNA